MATTYVRNSEGNFELVGPGSAYTDTTLSQTGKPADAAAVGSAISILNGSLTHHTHTLADLGIQYGSVVIDCVENTVSKAHVTFDREYVDNPAVVVSSQSGVPGTYISEVSFTDLTPTGFDACIYRANNTATRVWWIAIGQLA